MRAAAALASQRTAEERGLVVPGPDDYTPIHTARRCRALRKLRQAVLDRVPDASVDVQPVRAQPRMLTTYVSQDADGRLFSVARALVEATLIDSAAWESFAEHEGESIARDLLGLAKTR